MYDEIPRRENFLSFSAKTFFLQKTWHHLSTWDAPHVWLHHGVHLLADMKAAISDKSYIDETMSRKVEIKETSEKKTHAIFL